MDKEVIIEKLREMADAIESGTGELITIEGTISGDASYDELRVGVRYYDQLKSVDNHTENTMDWAPSGFVEQEGKKVGKINKEKSEEELLDQNNDNYKWGDEVLVRGNPKKKWKEATFVSKNPVDDGPFPYIAIDKFGQVDCYDAEDIKKNEPVEPD